MTVWLIFLGKTHIKEVFFLCVSSFTKAKKKRYLFNGHHEDSKQIEIPRKKLYKNTNPLKIEIKKLYFY